VLLGNRDGTFRPAVTYEASGYLSTSVALGDLNGDGKLDLALTNTCGSPPIDSDGNCPFATVDVMLGNGDGTFGPPSGSGLSGWAPVSIALGDVNGDGMPETVVADICNAPNKCTDEGCTCTSSSVEVLGRMYDAGARFGRSVACSDVNGTGRADVVVANSGAIGVLLNNGDGTLQPVVTYQSPGVVDGWSALAVRDVNGDGKPDLLVAATLGCTGCNNDSVAGVLLGNGDGTFQPPVTYSSGGQYARSVAVADVNGDGKLDLIVASCSGIWPDDRAVGILTGNGNGTFQPAVVFNSGASGTFAVAAGDLNKDGKPDVVTVNTSGLGLGVLLNNTNAQKQATSSTISSSLNPSIYGQKVTWTATVTSSGSSTPTGKVKFTWSTYTIGSAILNSSGVATFSRSNLNAGTFPLTAVYVGDAANLGSTSGVLNQVVMQTTSSASLTSSPNPSASGQAVTFTATITSPTVLPTGPVTFAIGKTVLGTAQLSGGKAKLTISTLAVGSSRVTATYYGNSNIAKSSASVTQTVNQ